MGYRNKIYISLIGCRRRSRRQGSLLNVSYRFKATFQIFTRGFLKSDIEINTLKGKKQEYWRELRVKITMKHDSGVTKEVKLGFSWTTLFFGGLVPLIRGDIKWFAIIFVIGIAVGAPTFGIGTLVADIIFSFVYNKIYIKELLVKGYKPVEGFSRDVLVQNNIISG